MRLTMSKQQVLQKQRELTASQILRTYGKQFGRITERYSDGRNGRCAMGVCCPRCRTSIYIHKILRRTKLINNEVGSPGSLDESTNHPQT